MIFRSSVELEYQAMPQAICEALWMHQQLKEIAFKNLIPTKW